MADPINPLFAVVFAFVDALGRKTVAKYGHRLDKRDPMIPPVQRGFGIMPLELIILRGYGIPV